MTPTALINSYKTKRVYRNYNCQYESILKINFTKNLKKDISLSQAPKLFMLKLPLLGDAAVGKTTLVRAFMGGTISEKYSPTLGVEIGRKIVHIELDQGLVEINFQLWDLAGQASFKTIRSSYYRGASGLVLVYDIGRRDTFINLEKWLEEAWGFLGHVPIVLVGNKLDLRAKNQEEVSRDEGKEYAERIKAETGLNTPFIEACAIRSQNADTPFKDLGNVIISHKGEQIK